MRFKDYILSVTNGRPFQLFFEADNGGGAGTGGNGGDGGNNGGGQNSNEPTNTNDNDPPNDDPDKRKKKIEFTPEQQDYINKLIGQKIKEEREKAEQKAEKAKQLAQMDAEQRLEAELNETREKLQTYNNRVINYEIKDVARSLGVAEKKLDRFLKLVDRDGIEVDDDGNVDREKVEQAVKAVLADFPEFKGPDASQKGPSDFTSGNGAPVKFTMAQIQSMTPQEIAQNYDEVMKAIAYYQGKK